MPKRIDSSDAIQKEKQQLIEMAHDPKTTLAMIYSFAKKLIGHIPDEDYKNLMKGLEKLHSQEVTNGALSEKDLEKTFAEYGAFLKANLLDEAIDADADVGAMNQLIDDALSYRKKELLGMPMTAEEKTFMTDLPQKITENVLKRPDLTKIAVSLASVQANVSNAIATYIQDQDLFQAKLAGDLSKQQMSELSNFVAKMLEQQQKQKEMEANQKKQKALGLFGKIFSAIVNAITKLPNLQAAALTLVLSLPVKADGTTLGDMLKDEITKLLDKIPGLPDEYKNIIASTIMTVIVIAVCMSSAAAPTSLVNSLFSATLMTGFFDDVTNLICDKLQESGLMNEDEINKLRISLTVIFTVVQIVMILKTAPMTQGDAGQGASKLTQWAQKAGKSLTSPGASLAFAAVESGVSGGSAYLSFGTADILKALAGLEKQMGDINAVIFALESLQKMINDRRSGMSDQLKGVYENYSSQIDLLKNAVKGYYGSR